MIIYGTRGKVRDAGPVQADACPNCGGTSFQVAREQGYAHIYWIPFFSIGGKDRLICHGCGADLQPKQQTPMQREAIRQQVPPRRVPIHHFAGLAIVPLLIAAFLGVGAISSLLTRRHAQEIATAPLPGHILVLDIHSLAPRHPGLGEALKQEPKLRYVIARIQGVKEGVVTLQLGSSAFERYQRAVKIARAERQNDAFFDAGELDYALGDWKAFAQSEAIEKVLDK